MPPCTPGFAVCAGARDGRPARMSSSNGATGPGTATAAGKSAWSLNWRTGGAWRSGTTWQGGWRAAPGMPTLPAATTRTRSCSKALPTARAGSVSIALRSWTRPACGRGRCWRCAPVRTPCRAPCRRRWMLPGRTPQAPAPWSCCRTIGGSGWVRPARAPSRCSSGGAKWRPRALLGGGGLCLAAGVALGFAGFVTPGVALAAVGLGFLWWSRRALRSEQTREAAELALRDAAAAVGVAGDTPAARHAGLLSWQRLRRERLEAAGREQEAWDALQRLLAGRPSRNWRSKRKP